MRGSTYLEFEECNWDAPELYDECDWCGDYRWQHEDGTGRCLICAVSVCGLPDWDKELGMYYCTAFNCAEQKMRELAGKDAATRLP